MPGKLFSARLPELTHRQLEAISEAQGLTKTQIVLLAVDRFARQLQAEDEDATRDARQGQGRGGRGPSFNHPMAVDRD